MPFFAIITGHPPVASSPFSTELLSAIVGTVSALIVAAGAIGTWGAMRIGRNTQILATYKAAAEGWENLANSLKAEKSDVEGRLDKAMTTVKGLEAKNQTLQDLVTGQPAIESLSLDMKASFRSLGEQMQHMEDALRGVQHGAGANPGQGP
ncbi:MAG: hypothetical protein JWM19_935 [Actinomycetia bacterium]|nr:hypothetical protein [Actinomycetes bacterium]